MPETGPGGSSGLAQCVHGVGTVVVCQSVDARGVDAGVHLRRVGQQRQRPSAQIHRGDRGLGADDDVQPACDAGHRHHQDRAPLGEVLELLGCQLGDTGRQRRQLVAPVLVRGNGHAQAAGVLAGGVDSQSDVAAVLVGVDHDRCVSAVGIGAGDPGQVLVDHRVIQAVTEGDECFAFEVLGQPGDLDGLLGDRVGDHVAPCADAVRGGVGHPPLHGCVDVLAHSLGEVGGRRQAHHRSLGPGQREGDDPSQLRGVGVRVAADGLRGQFCVLLRCVQAGDPVSHDRLAEHAIGQHAGRNPRLQALGELARRAQAHRPQLRGLVAQEHQRVVEFGQPGPHDQQLDCLTALVGILHHLLEHVVQVELDVRQQVLSAGCQQVSQQVAHLLQVRRQHRQVVVGDGVLDRAGMRGTQRIEGVEQLPGDLLLAGDGLVGEQQGDQPAVAAAGQVPPGAVDAEPLPCGAVPLVVPQVQQVLADARQEELRQVAGVGDGGGQRLDGLGRQLGLVLVQFTQRDRVLAAGVQDELVGAQVERGRLELVDFVDPHSVRAAEGELRDRHVGHRASVEQDAQREPADHEVVVVGDDHRSRAGPAVLFELAAGRHPRAGGRPGGRRQREQRPAGLVPGRIGMGGLRVVPQRASVGQLVQFPQRLVGLLQQRALDPGCGLHRPLMQPRR